MARWTERGSSENSPQKTPRSPKGSHKSLSDRIHKANQKVKDLRQRRASAASTPLQAEEAAELLSVPKSLATLNKIARIFCMGCSYPKQSSFHTGGMWLLMLITHSVSAYLTNRSRVLGNCSGIVQVGVLAVQVSFFCGWRHAQTHRVFDNVIKIRARTILLLTEAGRKDLADQCDEKVIVPISTQLTFVDPVLVSGAIATATWMHLFPNDVSHAAVYQCIWFIFVVSNSECGGRELAKREAHAQRAPRFCGR
jgi:hypothetical protein